MSNKSESNRHRYLEFTSVYKNAPYFRPASGYFIHKGLYTIRKSRDGAGAAAEKDRQGQGMGRTGQIKNSGWGRAKAGQGMHRPRLGQGNAGAGQGRGRARQEQGKAGVMQGRGRDRTLAAMAGQGQGRAGAFAEDRDRVGQGRDGIKAGQE